VTIRDAEFGPIRVRAFGSFSFRIDKVAPFTSRLLGTLSGLTVSDIEPQLRSAIATSMATGLGGGGTPFLDLAANQAALSESLRKAVEASLEQWGLTVPSLFIESLSLPEEVQKAIDAGGSMRVIGDLDRYAKYQAAEAMEIAAAQSGGVAGIGAGAAAGMAIGQAMAGGMAQAAQPAAPAVPAAPEEDPFAVIEKMHKLLRMGAISQEEFDTKKAEVMGRIR
jgi:membrane protease subunit (stomatin/prohibitin family)